MARKRFRNKTKYLQLVYDEQGEKREIVPNGTVILEESWGRRFAGVLELVVPAKTQTANDGKKDDGKKEDKK